MPNWPNAAAFARDLEKVQRDIDREAALKINVAAAEEAQKIAYREAGKDLGGDPKFSGWRPWLKLEVIPRSSRGAALLRPTRQSAGPWTVAEFGRNTMTGPKVRRNKDGSVRTYKRGDRKGQVMFQTSRKRWNGYTQGKGTATRAAKVMDDKIPDGIDREFGKLLRKRFDVS